MKKTAGSQNNNDSGRRAPSVRSAYNTPTEYYVKNDMGEDVEIPSELGVEELDNEPEEVNYSYIGKTEAQIMKAERSKARKAAPSGSQSRPASRPASKSSHKSKSHASKSKKGSKKKKKSNVGVKVTAILLSLVAIAAVVVGAMYFMGFFKPKYEVTLADGTVQELTLEELNEALAPEVFPMGVVIDGVDVGGMTIAEAIAAVDAVQVERFVQPDISIKVQEQLYPLDLSSLTFTPNIEEVVNEAYVKYRPTTTEDATLLVNLFNTREQLKNTHDEYETAYTCSTEGLSAIIEDILVPMNVDPVEATITGFNTGSSSFDVEPETNGFAVDSDAAITDVENLLKSDVYTGVVEVNAEVIVPEITEQFIRDNYGLISSTSSSTDSTASRNNNIDQACKYIDGTVLNPGDTFSFNEVVGMRTAARGFKEATVIAGGQYEQGYGGGICQVSTMLYGSVIKANLKVEQRKPHAWPSSYCDPGLDATVDWGNIDFQFTNNTEYQIVVRAFYSSQKVTCQIYGHYLPDHQTIAFVSVVNSRSNAGGTVYVENPNLAVGKTNDLRAQHNGLTCTSYQVWYDENGNEVSRNEVARTTYQAYPRKVEVGTKMPDGSHAELDTSTGKVITPTPTPSPTSTPSPTPAPTQATNPPTPTPVPPPPPVDDPGGEEGGGE